MTTTLDTVLTVAIGRNLFPSGEPMGASRWTTFQTETWLLLNEHGTIVCHAGSQGGAICSDGVNEGKTEDSAVFIVINPTDESALRARLADLLARYEQHSACFSVDHLHEPCFSGTTDGHRPALEPDVDPVRDEYRALEAALDEGFARRTFG